MLLSLKLSDCRLKLNENYLYNFKFLFCFRSYEHFLEKGMVDYYTKGKYVNYVKVLCGGDICKVYQRELLRVELQRELLH